MSFSITDFKDQMAGDGARPNLFEVSITHEDTTFFTVDDNDKFMIRATSIPGATLGSVVVPYFGREVKFAGNRTFADWTVTVINDEGFKVRARLEQWMDKINSHSANIRGGTVNKYYGKAEVKQLGKAKDTAIRSYSFVNLFPIDLSEITLDWGDNDSIEEFTCTFSYDYWTATSAGSPANKPTTVAIT